MPQERNRPSPAPTAARMGAWQSAEEEGHSSALAQPGSWSHSWQRDHPCFSLEANSQGGGKGQTSNKQENSSRYFITRTREWEHKAHQGHGQNFWQQHHLGAEGQLSN